MFTPPITKSRSRPRVQQRREHGELRREAGQGRQPDKTEQDDCGRHGQPGERRTSPGVRGDLLAPYGVAKECDQANAPKFMNR